MAVETTTSSSIAPEASKKENEKQDAALGHRLTSAIHTAAVDILSNKDQVLSKGASVAKEAQNQITRAATTTVRTVKQGGQKVTKIISLPFATTNTKYGSSERADDNANDSNQPTDLISNKIYPSLTSSEPPLEELPLKPDVPTTTNCTESTDTANKIPASLNRIVSSTTFDTSKDFLMGLVDDDRMVVWVVVASVAFVVTVQNLGVILHETSVPLSVAGAWMLVAFTVGMEVDGTMLVETIKYHFLGPPLAATTTPDSTMVDLTNVISEPSSEVRSSSKRNPVRYIYRLLTSRRHKERLPPPPTTRTSLTRTVNQKGPVLNSMGFDATMVLHLTRFGREKAQETNKQQEDSYTENKQFKTDDQGDVMGRMDSDDSRATVLLSKTNVQPMCRLRGIDIFLTDCAESPMSTHPFLLRNGLRNVPTFLANMMTQWGNILIYYELPEWVKDNSTSLVETETDPDDVKALKRFLAGDDEYRKKRLKIVVALVQAPLPVKLLAPKDVEITIFQEGFLDTLYHSSHESNTDNCPIYEVTFDLMSTYGIRGMASIVKRNLSSVSVDLGLVLSKPDGQTEEEPGAALGLWRFDHIDVSKYPSLPNRFETAGSTAETSDALRARLLVEQTSKRLLMDNNAR